MRKGALRGPFPRTTGCRPSRQLALRWTAGLHDVEDVALGVCAHVPRVPLPFLTLADLATPYLHRLVAISEENPTTKAITNTAIATATASNSGVLPS